MTSDLGKQLRDAGYEYDDTASYPQNFARAIEHLHAKSVALLFQSGYLTVKDYDPVTESYTLGVPDEEVRRDLCTLMAGVAANESVAWAGSLARA